MLSLSGVKPEESLALTSAFLKEAMWVYRSLRSLFFEYWIKLEQLVQILSCKSCKRGVS